MYFNAVCDAALAGRNNQAFTRLFAHRSAKIIIAAQSGSLVVDSDGQITILSAVSQVRKPQLTKPQ